MKINPETHKDLLGKKLIYAYLYLGNDKGGRVENIKEATFKIVRPALTKIKIIERKNDWQEIAYFDKPDRFGHYTVVTFKKGDLREKIERFRNTAPNYTYFENQDDYYCGDVADYTTLDEGQTDEEIRTILEEKVKEEFEKEAQALEKRIAWLKEKEETLKRFMK
jgi:hypothetical protein